MTWVLRRWVGSGLLASVMVSTFAISAVRLHSQRQIFTVGFSHGERLADEADAVEQQIANAMAATPDAKANIVGYTVPGSDSSADYTLSMNRAVDVMQALVDRGINPKRLEVIGGGGTNPPSHLPDESDAAWEHRASRVEVTVGR